MIGRYQQEDVNTKNEDSLRTLMRAIALSEGQFSLILARCNYTDVRERLTQQLRERCPLKLHELVLHPFARTLYTTIKAELGDDLPSAVIISGLEVVNGLDGLLVATNHARDEFRKNFPFPLVLWVTDEVLQKFIRVAPDFISWAATPIGFAIATDELINTLYQSADSVFNAILKTGFGKFLDNAALNLAIGSHRRLELESALKDLQNRGQVLEPELEANLQFLLGRDADAEGQIEKSRYHYEQSLALLLGQESEIVGAGLTEVSASPQVNPINPPVQDLEANKQSDNPSCGESAPKARPKIQNPKLIERQGCLLFYLGLWWRRYATQHRSDYLHACRQARDYFQQCLDVFKEGNRPDLMAKFINALGEVLQKLEQWNELETIAKLAIQLHQDYPAPIRLAYGYGLLAEVALKEQAYRIAEQYAYLALQTNSEWSELACQLQPEEINCGWSRQHDQNLYLLLLAEAERHLAKIGKALNNLETAKAESNPQYDPSQYIRILEALRSLYLEQGQYLEGFRIKQEQRLIEHQYGFRAFIGAGQLQPQCQVVNPAIAPVDNLATIAQEIAASGRQQDLNRLLERISRPDCKLTVIHGPSGVGKSSLVTAGLVPALKQRAIGERDALPLVVRVYTNWINDLGQSLLRDLGTSLADALHELRDINLTAPVDSPELILRQLRKNGDRNLLTVLIFDQIEEFFFVCTDQETRCRLYRFLRDCLNIPYVKIILSLREDYLHYLLECERCVDLDIINNNILDKKIRYYLGNFTPEDAKVVIQSLNERSQFYLEPALINALVQDLAGTLAEVRPIELQVVGAQLQEEEITTLEQYQHLGFNPKEKLVERFLQEAIKDCGSPNARTALLVLYLLTNENGTRPLKTRAELALGLQQIDLDATEEQLDLVLEILVKSGLLMLLPEAPADRYQLVHDYLVSFIRQKKEAEIGLEAALQRERTQRELTEQKLKRVRRQRLQVTVAGLVVTLLAFTAAGFGLLAESQRKQTEIAEIEALSSLSSARLLSDDQLGALVESVNVGKRLKQFEEKLKTSVFGIDQIPSEIKIRTLGSLQQAVYRVQERNRIEQQTGTFTSATFSPDGKTFASGNIDGTVKIWRLDGTLVSSFKAHSDRVNNLSFSPDSKTIATASTDKTVKLWRFDGSLITSFQGHTDRVNSVSFSPDGQTIATVSADKTIKLWHLDGTLLRTLPGHNDSVNSVSLSSDNQTLASASADGTVKLWRLDGTLLKTLKGHTGIVNSVSFSPNGKLIASASEDKTVKLWKLDGTVVKNVYGHTDNVTSVSFSPNGQSIASASKDKTIKLWKLDGTILKSLEGHTNWVRGVSFNQDGTAIASVSDDNTIKLWRFNSTQLKTLEGHTYEVNRVSFSPDGQLIASAGEDKTVKLWKRDGTLVKSLEGHLDRVNSISFSPDSQLIASASTDKTVKLWSVDGTLLKTFFGHTDWVNSVSFSPNGKLIASASADKTVKLWKIDGRLANTFKGHNDWVNSVSFSPDGKVIASASSDGTVKLWKLDGTLLPPLRGLEGNTSSFNDVSFSPDGKMLAAASADGTIKLWKLDEDDLPISLYGHMGTVNGVSFSPDGKAIASASADKTIKFWSLDGTLLTTLTEGSSSVNSVSFSPDGKTIASASDEPEVILWNFDLDDLLVRGCDWLRDYLNNPNGNIRPVKNRRICDVTSSQR